MCQICVDAIKKYWPDLPEDKWGDFLMSCTCYPAGCGEQVAEQVKEMAEKSGCDLKRAMGIANQEMEEAMRACLENIHVICCDCARAMGGKANFVATTMETKICPVCEAEKKLCSVHKWEWPPKTQAIIGKGKI